MHKKKKSSSAHHCQRRTLARNCSHAAWMVPIVFQCCGVSVFGLRLDLSGRLMHCLQLLPLIAYGRQTHGACRLWPQQAQQAPALGRAGSSASPAVAAAVQAQQGAAGDIQPQLLPSAASPGTGIGITGAAGGGTTVAGAASPARPGPPVITTGLPPTWPRGRGSP
jgi:hypothetical protein